MCELICPGKCSQSILPTSVSEQSLSATDVVSAYKDLAEVERAFHPLKGVDLKIRPIYHRLADRVRAHVFICMLAYYVEWHMRRSLAPILFDDDDRESAQAARQSIVAPAESSPKAKRKAATKRTDDDLPVHSFQGLLRNLATLTKNRIKPTLPGLPGFDKTARPTQLQRRAFNLLGVRP